jgi:hypothetical protein
VKNPDQGQAGATGWRCLDKAFGLTTMSAVQATARDFTRKFPVYRHAARAGQTVRVRDRDGVVYVFARERADAPSLAAVVGHLKGCVHSGRPQKDLRGFGRD